MTTDVLPARILEQRVRRDENIVAFRRIRAHATRVHLAVVADRPDIALDSAGQIVSITERRLRQLGGDAA